MFVNDYFQRVERARFVKSLGIMIPATAMLVPSKLHPDRPKRLNRQTIGPQR